MIIDRSVVKTPNLAYKDTNHSPFYVTVPTRAQTGKQARMRA